MDQLLHIPEVAERLKVAESTIRAWRLEGVGPRSARIGKRVVYRAADVEAWIDEQFAGSGGGSAA